MVVKGQPTRLTLTAGAAHNRDIADETDYAACRTIMLNASRNYSIASRFLPADRRRHVEALYALLRVGDDRVDVSHEGFDTALAAINDWERAYWHAFETGTSPHPVMRAYLDTAARFEIPPGVLAPYFRAMRDDLTVTRFPTGTARMRSRLRCSSATSGATCTRTGTSLGACTSRKRTSTASA